MVEDRERENFSYHVENFHRQEKFCRARGMKGGAMYKEKKEEREIERGDAEGEEDNKERGDGGDGGSAI